jgi:hypothetical protein
MKVGRLQKLTTTAGDARQLERTVICRHADPSFLGGAAMADSTSPDRVTPRPELRAEGARGDWSRSRCSTRAHEKRARDGKCTISSLITHHLACATAISAFSRTIWPLRRVSQTAEHGGGVARGS